MQLGDPKVQGLLRALAETHDEELDCEAYLDFMPHLAELRAQHPEPGVVPPELLRAEQHERLCANCREETTALLELLRAEAV